MEDKPESLTEEQARNLLRTEIERRFSSQTEAAAAIGLPQSTINQAITGARRIPWEIQQMLGIKKRRISVIFYDVVRVQP